MSQTTDEGKACAILSYLIIGIIWFFADKKIRRNTFARFHVKQAIVFIMFLLIINVAVAIFSMVSKDFGELLGVILYVVMVVFWMIAVINTAAGKEHKIPVIGMFAKKLDF